jgi:hypothetical protein
MIICQAIQPNPCGYEISQKIDQVTLTSVDICVLLRGHGQIGPNE